MTVAERDVVWLPAATADCSWLTRVGTGGILLIGASLASARRVTTHHDQVEALRARSVAALVEGVRYVLDGDLVKAAGVMAARRATGRALL